MAQGKPVRGPIDAADGDCGAAGYCEVSTAIRLLGDRWSLLIVRELAVGNTRFTEIHQALPGLSRSLLVTRLRYLERLSIIERRSSAALDRRSKQRYALTEVGWGLTPALRALGHWALTWQIPIRAEQSAPGTSTGEEVGRATDPRVQPATSDPHTWRGEDNVRSTDLQSMFLNG